MLLAGDKNAQHKELGQRQIFQEREIWTDGSVNYINFEPAPANTLMTDNAL
jgi:hypothetical protein